MDTNLLCILCTECIKACGHDNIALRFRAPGRDLWAMRRPRVDGAFAAITVVASPRDRDRGRGGGARCCLGRRP